MGASNKGGAGKTSYILPFCVNMSISRWPWMTLNCYKFIFSRTLRYFAFWEAYQGCRALTYALARLSCFLSLWNTWNKSFD